MAHPYHTRDSIKYQLVTAAQDHIMMMRTEQIPYDENELVIAQRAILAIEAIEATPKTKRITVEIDVPDGEDDDLWESRIDATVTLGEWFPQGFQTNAKIR